MAAKLGPVSNASRQLQVALEAHDTEALRKLLQNGVDPNTRTEDLDTPVLWIALSEGDEPAVRLLAEFGADVELLDGAGRSALSRAASAGDNSSELRMLLGVGAMVDAQDQSGWTVLHHASVHGYRSNVECLLEAGADRERETQHGLKGIDLAARNGHTRTATVLSE
ncbi:MAG: ankyrin repeat domain-containing protein [Sulfitobacter sp.]|nr:ankyrin repeat domain-containing protein [Sulfitobacter sp.]